MAFRNVPIRAIDNWKVRPRWLNLFYGGTSWQSQAVFICELSTSCGHLRHQKRCVSEPVYLSFDDTTCIYFSQGLLSHYKTQLFLSTTIQTGSYHGRSSLLTYSLHAAESIHSFIHSCIYFHISIYRCIPRIWRQSEYNTQYICWIADVLTIQLYVKLHN